MSELRDPAIKLFGKTIPLPESLPLAAEVENKEARPTDPAPPADLAEDGEKVRPDGPLLVFIAVVF